MRQTKTSESTIRRHKTADFINSFGDEMVKPCDTCVKHKRVCKVHVRSGRCGECYRRGQRCGLQVSSSEWERLKKRKEELRKGIREAYEAQVVARKAEEQAHEAMSAAFAKEMRLRRQMDLLDDQAEEALAVEDANIRVLESEEQGGADETLLLNDPPSGPSLAPTTWSAWDGLPDDFWDTSFPVAESASGVSG